MSTTKTLNWAMIFAAGKGTRMMPLTANRPKPMIEVQGQPLLGHALDRVAEAGIGHVVVNAHYCADYVKKYLPTRITPADIRLSYEPDLLETGGGVKKALQERILDTDAPFIAINADVLLGNGTHPVLQAMMTAWQHLGNAVDVLLLLIPLDAAWGHEAPHGDYRLDKATNKIQRLDIESQEKTHVYAGIQITSPALYYASDLGERFSNLEIFNRAERAGRLFGLVHDGSWHHFSTPQSLAQFEQEEKESPSQLAHAQKVQPHP